MLLKKNDLGFRSQLLTSEYELTYFKYIFLRLTFLTWGHFKTILIRIYVKGHLLQTLSLNLICVLYCSLHIKQNKCQNYGRKTPSFSELVWSE